MEDTGQVELDSYIDAGVIAAAGLVNGLTPGWRHGRQMSEIEPHSIIRAALACDPPSLTRLRQRDIPGFVGLAGLLRKVFLALDGRDLDRASDELNRMLAQHPAAPHLAKETGVWRLHHHAPDAAPLPMWTSICAEGIARMIGTQAAHRLGVCGAPNCDRVYVDTTRNASRRFCSTTCQNRVKTAAFRLRRR